MPGILDRGSIRRDSANSATKQLTNSESLVASIAAFVRAYFACARDRSRGRSRMTGAVA